MATFALASLPYVVAGAETIAGTIAGAHKPKTQTPTQVATPAAPDPALIARQNEQAAAYAAAIAKRRAQGNATIGTNVQTGAQGLTQPAYVQRTSLLGL